MVTRALLVLAVLVAACGRALLGDAQTDSAGGDGSGGDDDDDDDDDGHDDDGEGHDDGDDDDDPECDLDDHDGDCDGDAIPDADDPFPDDPLRPGRARNDVIYLQASDRLSILEMRGGTVVTEVAPFSFPDGGFAQVTDIAIDRFGVLYALAGADLCACEPSTAECWVLAQLPANSLGVVPFGVLDDDDDTLVTLAGSQWTAIALRGPEVSTQVIGDTAPYSSSGDIATIASGETLFTSPSGGFGDVVVQLDPTSGAIQGERGSPATDFAVWGMVAYDGVLVLCDQIGQISTFDPATGAATRIGDAPHDCWGAAAHPDLR